MNTPLRMIFIIWLFYHISYMCAISTFDLFRAIRQKSAQKSVVDMFCKLCYKLYENLCGLFRAQATFSPHNAMRCVFLWQKNTLRYYEKAETSERSRLSCGNSAACVFRRHAHERGFRHLHDSRTRLHIESGCPFSLFRASGICHTGDTLCRLLRGDEKLSHILSVLFSHLPAVRCG